MYTSLILGHPHFLFADFASAFPSCILGHPKWIVTCGNLSESSPDVIREFSLTRKFGKLDVAPFNNFIMLLGGATQKSLSHSLPESTDSKLSTTDEPIFLHTCPHKEYTNKQDPLLGEACCSFSATAIYQHLRDAVGHNSSF